MNPLLLLLIIFAIHITCFYKALFLAFASSLISFFFVFPAGIVYYNMYV
jgi:hypothetical protein